MNVFIVLRIVTFCIIIAAAISYGIRFYNRRKMKEEQEMDGINAYNVIDFLNAMSDLDNEYPTPEELLIAPKTQHKTFLEFFKT